MPYRFVRLASGEDCVVDEAGGADPGGDGEKGSWCSYVYGLECGPIDQGNVVDTDRGRRRRLVGGLEEDFWTRSPAETRDSI